MEQKTVNLVIVIAAVVIAAGAWSAPLLTAQTTHTLIQGDLADAITTINQNTDSETGAIGAGFFGAGTDLDASFGDCTLMDLMISIALDENINQLCSPDEIQSFIESDIHFAEFNDQFEFEEQFIEILPMELLPNRDCAGNDLTDAEIFAYQNTGAAGSRTFQTDNAVGGGGAAVAAGVFGAVQCIHQFAFEDTPLQVKAVSLQDTDDQEQTYARLQLALVDINELLGGTAPCGDTDTFLANIIYDGVFDLSAVGKDIQTISGDLMIALPPNGDANLCARIATGTPIGADENYAAFLTVQDILPLSIINFIPPLAFQFFDFDHFAPIDFTDSCNIQVLVEDFNGNPIQNIPVTLLDPFLDGAINGPANAVGTDINGLAVIGAGIDLGEGGGVGGMPSAFYVIDVNVDEQGIAVAVDNNFGQSFPDRFVDCTDDEFGVSGNLSQDADGAADGTVTILAVLPQFGGGGFEGATIGVFVENSVTGQAIPNIQLEISGVNFSEAAINFDGVENFQTTDAFGEVFFEGLDNNLDGLPGGDYTITFDGDAGLQSATTMVFVPPGFGGFIDVFLQISPT